MKYTEQTFFKMTTDMRLGLEKAAEENDTSMAWVIRKAITEHLDKNNK